MIGRAYKLGTGFKGLAAYLERGHREALNPDRLDWVESRNLPTRDPETAACLMRSTARDSERVRKPVYHLSISFDPGDPVDRETMRRVADRTLRDLGLQEHQAVILAHKDRQHPHVHIMVNRVHPERGTAWSNSWDYRRIEESLRQQEADLGLRVVPGKHAPVPEHGRERLLERAPEQRVRGDGAFLERVRAEAGPHLTGARTWGELERGLADHGLSLRMKGRGMVVTDGTREVKASEVDAAASRFRLERRLGSFTDYRARQAVAARTLDERTVQRATSPQVQERTPEPPAPERPAIPAGINREQRPPEVQRAPAGRTPADARPAPAPAERRTRPRTGREPARDFSREARALYDDPAAARRAFLAAAERRGADRAAATFRDEPHRFGRLRPGADPARSERVTDAAFEYARQRAASERGPLKQAAALLREGNVREAASRLMSLQIGKGPEKAAQLAARLVPMVPTSAVQLVKQAFEVGKTLALGHDRERERERGLSR